jgi:hypothetical protein
MERKVILVDGVVEDEKLAEPLYVLIFNKNGEENIILTISANSWITNDFFKAIDYETLEYDKENKVLRFKYNGKAVELKKIDEIEGIKELEEYGLLDPIILL